MGKKRVLVCGGAGYIGGLTCDTLIREGFEVAVYDNLLYENRYLKDIPFIYGDIRDTQKLYETGVCLPSAPSLRDEDIDFVINTIKNFYEGNNQ